METRAEHRITYDYREDGGDWERVVVATLATSEVIDLLMWLAVIEPAAVAALSELEQEAVLQSIADPDSEQSVPAAVAN